MDNNVNLEEMVKNMDEIEFMFFTLILGALFNPNIKKFIDEKAEEYKKHLD